MPTSVAHAPMVCLPHEVEALIGQAAGAWRQALECECRGDANAAVAWHLHARDLGERAERLARGHRPTAERPSAPAPPAPVALPFPTAAATTCPGPGGAVPV
jgi:hypothetical protein